MVLNPINKVVVAAAPVDTAAVDQAVVAAVDNTPAVVAADADKAPDLLRQHILPMPGPTGITLRVSS